MGRSLSLEGTWKQYILGREEWTDDLVLKCVYLGGEADLIINVALIHELGGNHMADDAHCAQFRENGGNGRFGPIFPLLAVSAAWPVGAPFESSPFSLCANEGARRAS